MVEECEKGGGEMVLLLMEKGGFGDYFLTFPLVGNVGIETLSFVVDLNGARLIKAAES